MGSDWKKRGEEMTRHWMIKGRQALVSMIPAAAVAVACLATSAAWAQDGLLEELDIRRDLVVNASMVEFGVLFNNKDSFKFGDYTGLEERGVYLVGSMDLWGRPAFDSGSPGYWRLKASNLGLDSRSASFEYGRQGRFALDFDFDETPKFQSDSGQEFFGGGSSLRLPAGWVPAEDTSGLTELGSSLRDLEIDHRRRTLGGGLSVILAENWKLRARFDHQAKEGAKLTAGIIAATGGNPRGSLIPEPIDYAEQKLDVGLEYATDRAQLQLAYYLSSFDNKEKSLSWDNPFLCPGGCGGSWSAAAEYPTGRGRKAVAPDNRFDQLMLSGAYNLPARTRVTMNAAVGRMKQDDSFLPYTVNSGLSVTTPLPRSSLDGQIDTTALHFRLSSRPFSKLSLTANYRYDDRDNRTPQNTYIYIPSDSTDQGTISSSTARINHANSYKKNEFDVGARYRLFRRTSLMLEYEHEQVQRDHAEVDTTRENMVRAKLRAQPMDRLGMGINMGLARRKASTYHHNEPYLTGHSPDYLATQSGVGLWENHPLLRRFYLTDRDRAELGAFAMLTPADRVSIGLNVTHMVDDFDDPEIGLTDQKTTRAVLDLSYAPTERIETYAFYSFEHFRFNDNGWSFRGFAKAADSADPDRRWSATNEDIINTAGVGFRVNLIEDKLDLAADYLFSVSRDQNDVDVGPALAAGPSFRDAVNRLHDVRVGLEYKVRRNLSVRLGYLYEKFSLGDWAYDGVGPQTLGDIITIGEEGPDYKAHLATWTFVYKFW
jgi:MtrB/PioB family decaheme-associated outer membrane protein